MSIRRVIVRKSVNAFVTIVIILVVNFILFRLVPGDPVGLYLRGGGGARPDESLLQQQREIFGLNDTLPVQLYKYIVNTFTGNWGYSFYKQSRLVTEIIAQKAVWTILLVGSSTIITLWIGMVLGVVSAWRRGKASDLAILGFGFFFYAMPTFWLALMLLLLFGQGRGVLLPIFPAANEQSYPPPTEAFAAAIDIGYHLFLPALTLALVQLAGISIIMRNALIDVLTEDFIVTAKAKGLSDRRLLKGHAIPNARLPMVTVIALNLGFVLGGAITVEYVFSYDGLGLLTVEAIYDLDYPILQGVFLILTVSVVVANLISDFVYAALDPRIRLE